MKNLEHSGVRYWHQEPRSIWRMTDRAWWLASFLLALVVVVALC